MPGSAFSLRALGRQEARGNCSPSPSSTGESVFVFRNDQQMRGS